MSLILNFRFKNLCLIFYFVGQEEGDNIVDEYDKRTLYPMLLKWYHHLHPMTKFVGCVNQTSDEDSSLGVKAWSIKHSVILVCINGK